jgi:hypothetical protein
MSDFGGEADIASKLLTKRESTTDYGEYRVASMPILAKRKAADLAALKLVQNELEEHVREVTLFDLD